MQQENDRRRTMMNLKTKYVLHVDHVQVCTQQTL